MAEKRTASKKTTSKKTELKTEPLKGTADSTEAPLKTKRAVTKKAVAKKTATTKKTTARSSVKKAKAAEPQQPAVTAVDLLREIETVAYYRWESRGRINGDSEADWFEAEKIVFSRYGI